MTKPRPIHSGMSAMDRAESAWQFELEVRTAEAMQKGFLAGCLFSILTVGSIALVLWLT